MSAFALNFASQTCAVIGGAGGIGRAVAIGFAEAGARVLVVDKDPLGASDAASEIQSRGGDATPLAADVSDAGEVSRLFADMRSLAPRLDVLVNAIWLPIFVAPEVIGLNEWNESLSVNVTSYFLTCQQAGRWMLAEHVAGALINVSSIAGETALGRNTVAYSTAKGAINALTKELAVEWGPYGIRTNAVLPCQVSTSAYAKRAADPVHADRAADVTSGIPMGRIAEVGDVVGPVLFLASPFARMINGALVPIDGGNLALNAGGSLRRVERGQLGD